MQYVERTGSFYMRERLPFSTGRSFFPFLPLVQVKLNKPVDHAAFIGSTPC